MPTLKVRKGSDVPAATHVSRAVREQQAIYEEFIRQIGDDVGELELGPGEQIRAMKVRLRRASTRLGQQIDIWDVDGRVYFTAQQQRKRRGRPAKQI